MERILLNRPPEQDIFLGRFFFLTRWLFDLAYLLGFSPFRLNPLTGKLETYSKGWARSLHSWLWCIAYGYLSMPTHFVEEQGKLRSLGDGRFKADLSLIYIVFSIGGTSVGVVILAGLVWGTETISQMLNTVYSFMDNFSKKYLSQRLSIRDKKLILMFHMTLFLCMGFCGALYVLVVIHGCFQPDAVSYPAFMIPKTAQFSSLVYTISLIWYNSFSLGILTIASLLAVHALTFFPFLVIIASNELQLGRSHYWTDSSLRTSKNILKTWKSLQVLCKIVNIGFGPAVVPLQIIATCLIVFCNAALVFQARMLKIYMILLVVGVACLTFFLWGCFLQLGGLLYSGSVSTLGSLRRQRQSWSTTKDKLYLRRVVWACRPLTTGDGKLYDIKPVSVLQFMDSLGSNTFRALVTLGEILDFEYLKN